MSSNPPQPGHRLGNYVLQEKVGQGAFATVWKAVHHERPGRVVALKVATDPAFRKQLSREGRLPDIHYPNVVPILDCDTRFADHPYVVMPFYANGNLADLIARYPNGLPEDRVETLLKDILSGLSAAHEQGIVHRDIKPANILIDDHGRALLSDFGLSLTDGAPDAHQSLIQSGSLSRESSVTLAGTLAYIAPEVLNHQPTTTATDVYSVGVVLFEMLTGRRPYGIELPSLARPSLSNAAYWNGLFYYSCCHCTERYADAAALKSAADGSPKPTPFAAPAWKSDALPSVEVVPRSFKLVAFGLVALVVFAVYSGFSAPALVIAIALASSTAVHLLGCVFVALAAGLGIKEVQFAFGKPLLRFRFGVLPVRVGYLPWGGSVSVDNESLERRSTALRFLLHVAGPIAVLCLTGVCIGYDRAAAELASGFRQIVQGALAPLTYGEHLVGRFFGLVESAPFLETIGVLSAKIAAFNLLPLPPSSGGLAVLSLVPGPSGSRGRTMICVVGIFVQLAIFACWSVSVCVYMWGAL